MADTREALIDLLRKTEINVVNGHSVLAEVCFVPSVFTKMADHLIAGGVTVAYDLSSTELLTDRQQWIPVTERLPEEHDSIFAKFYGTEKWVHGMFRTISNDVNTCVEYEDGTRKVKTLHTLDGKWNLKGMGGKKVTHWKPLPELPKGE